MQRVYSMLTPRNELRIKGVLTVCGGLLIHAVLAAPLFTFGNISPYFTSYLRFRTTETTLRHSDSFWVAGCAQTVLHVTLMCSGAIESKLGPRMTTLLGGFLYSLGMLLTYFAVQSSLVAVTMTYGVLYGAGYGVAYSSSVRQAMEWFPEHISFVCGIVIAGVGVSAITFTQIETMYTNPNNLVPNVTVGPNNDKYFDEDDVLDRVPSMFALLGVICAVFTLIGVLILFDPPNQQEIADKTFFQQLTNTEDETEDTSQLQNTAHEEKDVHPLEMIKRRNFWMLWLVVLANGEAFTFILSLYKAYGETFIHDDHFLALVGSVTTALISVGRLFWGAIADRLSIRAGLVLQNVIVTFLLLTFTLSEKAGKWMFFAWMAGMLCTLAGTTANILSATAMLFRMKYFVTNYGLIASSMIPGGILGSILSQSLSDYMGWSGIFYLIGSFSFVGLLFSFLIDVKE